MARLIALALSAFACAASAQPLTAAAKASPYSELWLTLDGPLEAPEALYQGSQPILGLGANDVVSEPGSDFVERFEAVPKAQETARRARTWQRVRVATFWPGMGMLGISAGIAVAATGRFSFAPTRAGIAATAVSALLSCGLQLMAVIAAGRWRLLLLEAVKQFNTGLNDRLPVDQRYELGELGLP